MALEVAYYTVFPMHEELQRLLLLNESSYGETLSIFARKIIIIIIILLLLLLLLLLYSVSQKTDRYD